MSKISALADDLALALAAASIRIEAPVPGKGYVGIEVPNAEISLVGLRDVIESEAFREKTRRCALRWARTSPAMPLSRTWPRCRTC